MVSEHDVTQGYVARLAALEKVEGDAMLAVRLMIKATTTMIYSGAGREAYGEGYEGFEGYIVNTMDLLNCLREIVEDESYLYAQHLRPSIGVGQRHVLFTGRARLLAKLTTHCDLWSARDGVRAPVTGQYTPPDTEAARYLQACVGQLKALQITSASVTNYATDRVWLSVLACVCRGMRNYIYLYELSECNASDRRNDIINSFSSMLTALGGAQIGMEVSVGCGGSEVDITAEAVSARYGPPETQACATAVATSCGEYQAPNGPSSCNIT